MADTMASAASGADPAAAEVRRRNVPGSAPEAPAQYAQAEEQKLHGKKKVQCHPGLSNGLLG